MAAIKWPFMSAIFYYFLAYKKGKLQLPTGDQSVHIFFEKKVFFPCANVKIYEDPFTKEAESVMLSLPFLLFFLSFLAIFAKMVNF